MKIIFVCTGNTCRSPLAEYIMRDYCKKNKLDIDVESRGLACLNGKSISENSYKALQEIGIDASLHKSKSFTLRDLFDADIIIAMTKSHKDALIYHFKADDKVKSFNEITGLGEINDPYCLGLDVYRECREKIQKGIPIIAQKLTKK